ncbi:3765_t:CDS:2 [Scutellospora calospora]|uniref:3765_t:CDS:1 n=1 Tax=Scutellospora calospora TaxID=85575 RepID=A0ACA9JU74_9GLOM|nr:3765_t:CDS:2 [Scutellospora calospora]
MSNHLDRLNKTELEIKTFELGNYPESPMITYKEKKNIITQRSFNYFIEAEGFYPNASQLHYTSSPKKYSIPNNYSVRTSWGCGKNQQTVQCKIVYKNGSPEFQIQFGTFFENEIKSCISATTAATNYEKAINKTSRLSGILLFGLQLQTLKNIRESRYSWSAYAKDIRQDLIKPAIQCSQSALDKRAKDVAAIIKEKFIQNSPFRFHEQDFILLKSLEYTINNQIYHFSFGDDFVQKEFEILNMVKIMDSNYISRDAYRELAAVNYHLSREHNIVIEQNNLTQRITNNIPIKLVNMNTEAIDNLETINELDNDNIDFSKVLNSVGTGGQRDCKGILRYIIPYLVHKNILSTHNPVIHLRISGDGHNVGRKVKHVMVTFMILNDREHYHVPSYHHTIALYPGTEKYESLEIILNPFINDLRDLKINGLEVEGIFWQFELYFSSDWKFLAICLELNTANLKHFCAWCLCSKQEIGNTTCDWRITKSMDNLKNNYHNIPEESATWKYISLTGEDKIKVLQYFNLAILFRPSRAKLIRSLWNKFIELYKAIFDQYSDSLYIKHLALEWLKLFLKPDEKDPTNSQNIVKGLYLPTHVTPYIHFLVFYGWELHQKHKQWGLKAFSCSAVEKKNHIHVSFFFRKTTMNGGNPFKRSAATIEILEYESRNIFFAYNDLPRQKVKKLVLNK